MSSKAKFGPWDKWFTKKWGIYPFIESKNRYNYYMHRFNIQLVWPILLISSFSTCLLLIFVSQESLETPPKLVTIFFGANDAALDDRAHRNQHVPLQEYKENLVKIISHIKVVW